jgi:predicted anti-sigma-YlaC factor YlaD
MSDCAQIRDAFVNGERRPEEQAREHLASCPQCRELFERDAELGRSLAAQTTTALPLARDFFAQIEQKLAREAGLRAWLRSRPSPLRFLFVLLALLLVLGAGGLLRQRTDFHSYPMQRVALLLFVYFVAIALAFGKQLSESPRRDALADYVGLLVFALAVPALAAFAPATELSRQAGAAGAFGCFSYGALLTFPIAFLLWAFDRNDRPSLRSVCLRAAALGLSANLLLELHCGNGNPLHGLLGHASLGVAWLAAWLVARRLSRA